MATSIMNLKHTVRIIKAHQKLVIMWPKQGKKDQGAPYSFGRFKT